MSNVVLTGIFLNRIGQWKLPGFLRIWLGEGGVVFYSDYFSVAAAPELMEHDQFL